MINKIPERQKLIEKIFRIRNDMEFRDAALEVFQYQYARNDVYRRFATLLGVNPEAVVDYYRIPFLPIDFFRTHAVLCGNVAVQKIFFSSGTTRERRSRHYVHDLSLYERSSLSSFRYFYGEPENYCFVTLLPSAEDAPDSSLVFMMNTFKRASGQSQDANFAFHYKSLAAELNSRSLTNRRVFVLGITYAMLDFAEENRLQFPEVIFMETGGMKGKRPEITREELHAALRKSFGVMTIHSEYGMTELLTQAYSKGNGIFKTPPWMKILLRDTNDPQGVGPEIRNGGINIIDLANIDSCSFIATQDLGSLTDDGGFEVSGRFDFSDLRGCNTMMNER